jgi:KipI family sensor histidine kinase inhibitor
VPRVADRARARRGAWIEPMGDASLLITLGDTLDLEANAWAHRLAQGLAGRLPPLAGLGAVVPGHASVLTSFDPDLLAEEALRSILEELLDATREAVTRVEGATHEIVVAYGGVDGPDLAEVAARTGLAEADVVRLHAGVEYRVLVLGFVPGFPYLGILPAALDLPRRDTPRVRVPAGSVAIAGRQTGIYPFATPGGWHLIGRTDAPAWDPGRTPPALFAPGDRIRFVPA